VTDDTTGGDATTGDAMTVLRAVDHVRMAWANGGGTTYEVATSPAGASLGSFDWRVSLADVVADGPFSAFPGVDRILVLLDGPGMELVVDGRLIPLDRLDPVRFDGAADTSCSLVGGPTRDLNVMTRRGRRTATAEVVHVDGEAVVPVGAGTTALAVVVDGGISVDGDALGPRDVLVVDRAFAARGTASLVVIRIGTA
jgi:environmental stress-induced protein Ves